MRRSKSAGRRRWSKRVNRIFAILEAVIAYDILYIGGGNAQLIEPPLPAKVKIVSNIAGITGGLRNSGTGVWSRRLSRGHPLLANLRLRLDAATVPRARQHRHSRSVRAT